MENELSDIKNELKKLMLEVAMIKNFLIPNKKDLEGELSDLAVEELEKARRESEEDYTSLEDL